MPEFGGQVYALRRLESCGAVSAWNTTNGR
jgi:hypothetical protein